TREAFMQNIPSSYVSLQPTPAIAKKERGTFLTLVLLFQTVVATAVTFLFVMGGAKLDQATQGGDASWHEVHHVASRVILAASIFQIAKLVSLMGIWAWKRWALLLYFASSVLGVVALYKITGSLSYWEIAAMASMFIGAFPRITMFED
ncbi:MAG: hypothetical protein ACRELY_04510, partial [Polyangiaceae bacterium]